MEVSPSDDLSSGQTFRLLQLDSILLGVPEDRVTRIVSWTTHATLPFAPTCVLGVVCVEGRMFTLIDPTSLMKHDGKVPSARSLVVALTGEEQLALTADSADESVVVNEKNIDPPGESASALATGVIKRDGTEIVLLDPDRLFPNVILGRERRRRRS